MLSTQEPHKIYRFIVHACKYHAEKLLNKKIEIQKIRFSKFPSYKFIFFFTFFIFSGKIFSRKARLDVEYSQVNIGRFILGSVFTDFSSYTSKTKYFYNYLKNFYIAGKFIRTANELEKKKNFECIYIDHCGSMNGILFSLLSKNKIVYTNNYPKNIFATKKKISSFNGLYEDRLRISKTKNFNNQKSKQRAKKVLKKLSHNPEIIPWMKGTYFNKFNKIQNIDQYEYIVYTHSFTDGQLWFGNDGFQNSFDWLIFTLDNLERNNKKTLIKCHPNYFNKDFGATSEWDKKIFNKIHEKYLNNKNFYFIREPIRNENLSKSLNKKKCIAITHHGNVVLEMGFLGFKVISSAATFCSDKFKISNIWSNQKEYYQLLNKKNSQLKNCKVSDLYQLVNELFFDKNSYYGINSIDKVIKKNINKNYSKILYKNNKLNFDSKIFDKIDYKIYEKIAKDLSKNITF